MASVEPKPVEWLWPGKIPLGKPVLIAGDPGLGKSLITTYIAAIVSTGGRWPEGDIGSPKGDVIMMSAEDDPADTIRIRLDAAGANVENIHCVKCVETFSEDEGKKEHYFSLAEDIAALELCLRKKPDTRLVIIDPISAYLSGTDTHNNADVRSLLMPLVDTAAKFGVAVLLVSHLNKASGTNALYRTSGSLAFVATVRAAFLVTKDGADPDRRLFLPVKNNLGTDQGGLAYRIVVSQETGAPMIAWEDDPVFIDASSALEAAHPVRASKMGEAKSWLTEELAHGPMAQKELESRAARAHIARRTIRRAKKALDVNSIKSTGANGDWLWELPSTTHPMDLKP